MRILVFSNLPPFVLGGAENQVARLVEAWADSGHAVEVAGHRIPSAVTKIGRHAVRTHRVRTFNRGGRIGRAVTYFTSTILLILRHARKFDVIYSRGLGDAAISICFAKSLGLVNLPLIACPINARGDGEAAFIKTIPAWRLLVRWINRQCNAINIIAPAILDDLKALNITAPAIATIPNGIPLKSHTQANRVAPFKRMVFTGRLSRQKGLDLLISALHEIRSMGYRFSLDIYGDGPLKAQLERQISQLSLENHVVMKGSLPVGAVRDRLLQYDVFTLPSRYEGMSNAALEAMEAGIPVMVSRCGGIDRYIDTGTGWVCETEDMKSIVKTLKTILDTPPGRLTRMGCQARALVEKKFEINQIAKKNVMLFKQVLNAARQ